MCNGLNDRTATYVLGEMKYCMAEDVGMSHLLGFDL